MVKCLKSIRLPFKLTFQKREFALNDVTEVVVGFFYLFYLFITRLYGLAWDAWSGSTSEVWTLQASSPLKLGLWPRLSSAYDVATLFLYLKKVLTWPSYWKIEKHRIPASFFLNAIVTEKCLYGGLTEHYEKTNLGRKLLYSKKLGIIIIVGSIFQS